MTCMTTYTVAEAKARFAELLREVEAGGHVTITRHGTPVAHVTDAHRRRFDSRVPGSAADGWWEPDPEDADRFDAAADAE